MLQTTAVTGALAGDIAKRSGGDSFINNATKKGDPNSSSPISRAIYGANNSPDAISANITRENWQHFLDEYRPVEEQMLKSAMQTDFSSEGDKAGAEAGASVMASRGTLARNLSRAGTRLNAEEQSAMGRRTDLAKTKAVGRAENTTRRTLTDTRTELLSNLVNIGRGVSNSAASGMNSVAGMAAQREAQYQQSKTANHNQNMSMAASAAAMLIFAV